MLRLFTKTSLILILALFLSVGIDFLYRHSYGLKYKWPQNVWIKPEIPEKYQIVKVGSSHAQDGLIFEKYKLRSLSLASVAQSFEYDLAMLKMYKNQIEKGAVIIINVSPMSFSQKKPGKAESLQYTYYDGRLSPFLIPNLQIGDYLQSQIIPFVRSTYLWRETYTKDVSEKAMSTFAANWPTPTPQIVPTDVPNPVVTSVATIQETIITPKFHKTAEEEMLTAQFRSDEKLQKSVIFMVDKWSHTGDFGPQYIETNQKDLENLIKYSLNRKWRPVVISIPISQRLLDGLGDKYMQTYFRNPLEKTNLYGSEYFDFSGNKKFRENAFFFTNSDHLSYAGGLIFSHMLLERLIEKGYLSKEADNY